MNRMSFAWSEVSSPTRSPGRSSTGPEVVRTFTPSSFAMSRASVVLPRPGGPKKSVWSRGSRRCLAASMAIWSDSLTFAWPTNSSRPDGRSAASVSRSSGSASGVVRCVRGQRRPRRAAARGGCAPRPRRPPRLVQPAELVGQFKRQPSGRLLPDPAHRREQRDVALFRRTRPTLHPPRGHQRDRDLRSHAAHPDQPLEEAAPGVVLEPVQRPAVLAHHQLGGEGDRLAHRGEALHHAQRDDDFVADAARRVDHHAIRLLGGEATGDLGDHVRRMYVSATATPSAASAGCGASLSRSRRATTRPICAFGAPPAPTTVFLIVAGAYSAMATPACSAASSTTPRAWPNTSVVWTLRP